MNEADVWHRIDVHDGSPGFRTQDLVRQGIDVI
jgi:hypothetical protein